MADNQSNEGAICPHCGHLLSADDYPERMPWLNDDELREETCDECGEEFEIQAVWTNVHWCTGKVGEDWL
jgi:methionyl-tRNA synthetase